MEMNIYEKLAAIQQKLAAPKDKYNQFGKYSYRSCEGILEALKPLLAETKTTILLTDAIRETGNRIYIEATATLLDVEEGKTITVTAYAREEDAKKGMDSSQVTGAASSYARKYALNGLFAIDDNKDSDATNTGDSDPKQGPPQPPQQRPQRQLPPIPQGQQAPPPPPQQGPPQPLQPPMQMPQPPIQMPQPKESRDGYFYCDDCKGIISGWKGRDKSLTPREIAVRSMTDFDGAQLCVSCYQVRKAARAAGG